MTHFLKTTLVVTLVIFLVSIWALEAKIAEKIDKFSALDAADTKAGGFPRQIKRNIFQFGQMIWCETRKNPWRYNGYGCYCGRGGGGEPVDKIDECCLTHDKCYDRIIHDKLCENDSDVYNEVYKRKRCSECASSNDDCEMAICKCDGAAAKCFAKYDYNPKYEDYPKSKCS